MDSLTGLGAVAPIEASTPPPGPTRAKPTITRTTITPAPGTQAGADTEESKRAGRDRTKRQRDELTVARPPYPGCNVIRLVMTTLLGALCLLTVGGAILMLLLWQQDRDVGVLTSQLDRTWDLFDTLRKIERILAFAVVPVAIAWIAVATVNVRRATGLRRNPIVAAASLPIGLFAIWMVGSRIVDQSDDWVGKTAGIVLQVVLAVIPLLAIERVAEAADSRHRPLRATYLIGVVYLIHLQTLGGLSTINATSDHERWVRLGAYLVIAALIQLLGTLAANEAARALEVGTEHRFMLRHKFGEAMLAQAARR